MLNINIKTIPHGEQRYPTIGDYWKTDDGKQEIRISDIGNDDYVFLVAIHELIEWYLTEKRGIKEEDIKKFDEKFEAERLQGLHTDEEDGGMDSRAPYVKEHILATNIEKELAKELSIAWDKYSADITKKFVEFEGSAS